MKFLRYCSALDSNGRQCKQLSVVKTTYHGDPEIYFNGQEPQWVRVYFCARHMEPKQIIQKKERK